MRPTTDQRQGSGSMHLEAVTYGCGSWDISQPLKKQSTRFVSAAVASGTCTMSKGHTVKTIYECLLVDVTRNDDTVEGSMICTVLLIYTLSRIP